MKGYSDEYIKQAYRLTQNQKFLPGRDLIKLLDYIGFFFWKDNIMVMAAINRLMRQQNIDVFLYHHGETGKLECISKTALTENVVTQINSIIEDRESIVNNIKNEFKL